MLGHLGFNVPDLVSAKSYYDELMALVGYRDVFAAEDRFAYGSREGAGAVLVFYQASHDGIYDRFAVGLQHVAFAVATRTIVRRAHALAVRRGDTVLDEPQDFPQYRPPYFATFWLDPHGFKLEVVCHHDRD